MIYFYSKLIKLLVFLKEDDQQFRFFFSFHFRLYQYFEQQNFRYTTVMHSLLHALMRVSGRLKPILEVGYTQDRSPM